MVKSKYMRYSEKSILSSFLGYITWMSLSAFMVNAKNEIGIDSIPIFEMLIFVSGILGVKIAYSKIDISIKTLVFINIISESVFLVSLYYLLLTSTMSNAGVSVYMIIILNAFVGLIISEKMRSEEDIVLTHTLYKGILKTIRKKNDNSRLIGGTIGTSIAVILLTYYEVELVSFTLVMLVLNIIQNIYDYYIWNVHLK